MDLDLSSASLKMIYELSDVEFANGWFSGFYFVASLNNLLSAEDLEKMDNLNKALLEEHKWDGNDD